MINTKKNKKCFNSKNLTKTKPTRTDKSTNLKRYTNHGNGSTI